MKENCYDYTKTDLYKLEKTELLKIYYEQEKDYYEHVNGSDKNYSKKISFEKFCALNNYKTIKELRNSIITK